jgi:hypothetical protein
MINANKKRQVIKKDGSWGWADEEKTQALWYEKSTYKNWLQLNLTETMSNAGKTKLSPREYLYWSHKNYIDSNREHEQNVFVLDLKTTSLIFEHFINGNLIIYGNTDYFIDDITYPNILNE